MTELHTVSPPSYSELPLGREVRNRPSAAVSVHRRLISNAGFKRDGHALGADYTVEPEARLQLDLNIFGRLRQRIIVGSATLCRTLQLQAKDNILLAEAVQLQVHDFLESECYESVLIENDVAVLIHLLCSHPTMNAKKALPGPTQVEADDLCIMETRDPAEPTE